MSEHPLVSVVIPARNEVADIAACIACVAEQHYPLDRIEVVVVDGSSTDGTAAAAGAALAQHAFHHTAVLANHEATTPTNLNVGLRYATGEIVCRVDARTRIEPHYVRTCVRVLQDRPEVAVVGGAQHAVARDGSARSVGIARALNNRYAMGGSPYRRSTQSGPSDTVYLGAFRRAELLEARGWDERLVTNQDFDLNRRMAARGLVWFEASLRSGYLPRATFADLWRQYVRFGRAKVAYWRTSGDRPQRRQQVLLALPVVGLLVLALSSARGRIVPVVGAGFAGVFAVERVGSDQRRARLSHHLAAALAMGCVGAGWTLGAWQEAAHR
ncbi:MAG TPA: glycosyltransferase [Acidimicrobiales bacterium]|nr:glycosyltransferase [Acidimicrobiales bacterium]